MDAVSSASCHDDLLSALTQSCVGSRDVCSVSGSGRLLVQHCTGEMEYTLDTPSGSLLPVAVGDHLRALLTSGAVNALCEDVLKVREVANELWSHVVFPSCAVGFGFVM